VIDHAARFLPWADVAVPDGAKCFQKHEVSRIVSRDPTLMWNAERATVSEPSPVRRIALFYSPSLTTLPALNRFMVELGDRVGLVVLSPAYRIDGRSFWPSMLRRLWFSGSKFMTFWAVDSLAPRAIELLANLPFRVARHPVLKTAEKLSHQCGAKVFEAIDVNAPSVISAVSKYDADVLVVLHLSQEVNHAALRMARLGSLVIHPVVAPFEDRKCPAFWALAEKRQPGVSIHRVQAWFGEQETVVDKVLLPVDQKTSVAELNSLLYLYGAGLLTNAIAAIERGADIGREPVGKKHSRHFPSRRAVAMATRAGVSLWKFPHLRRLFVFALKNR